MRLLTKVVAAGSLTLVTAAVMVLTVRYEVTKTVEGADFSKLGNLLKSNLGEVITVSAVAMPNRALSSHVESAPSAEHGLAIDTPAQVRERDQLWDTYDNATKLLAAAVALSTSHPLPADSTQLADVSSRYKLDAWGRPFCLAGVGQRIAAISGGPAARDVPLSCKDTGINARDIARLPLGRLCTYPSGELVVVAENH